MIYLSLGSNLGNRLSNFRKAVKLLKDRCFSTLKESIAIETPALLLPNAPSEWNKPYLNMVVYGETSLSPTEFLRRTQQIEQEMGRETNHPKWGPRIIDLDILLWNQNIIDLPGLKIPHRELLNRPFWLHLMAMLSPESCIPTYPGVTIGHLAHQTPSTDPCFIRSFVLNPQFVGVVNITPDSFSDGGLYLKPENAVHQVFALHEAGAAAIEIGAQSTRPGASIISPEEEYQRLESVLESIKMFVKTHEVTLSLDSFYSQTISKVLKNYPIAWVNDQKGDLSDAMLKEIASHGASLITMHSITLPPNRQDIISSSKVIEKWAEKTLTRLTSCGFAEKRIILDPGIGFGKSAYQNLWLLKNITSLKKFGYPIMAGHSRKSYINAFYFGQPHERDLETIAISDELSQSGVDYLRVHEVAAHQRFFVAKKSIKPLQ